MEDKKVLIVEDDEFLLQMYSTKLELEGFKVLEAINGLQGLKVAQKEKPDLILLDLNLPEMSGFEVLSQLKRDDDTKGIRILILTNYSQKEDIDRCLGLGADDYLIKAHFVPSEVINKIKVILEKEEE
ncbi:MAG: response regulator [Candidatus Komeilibacteria bacterium]|jgi:DNA-binding response OmpR family regulator|nr:response regulator [Candidatus Komeilibacteria bacterium]MBT4447948.1 response regulator [Candidatus Komeilibacteria bacterium]